MKTVAIHQPNFLPWLGYFFKISRCDVFVILDDVDYQSGNASSLTNRTRLKGPNGVFWLTVPVKSRNESRLIRDINIDYNQGWQKKLERTLQACYGRHPFFKNYVDGLLEIIRTEHTSLSRLNTELIQQICAILEINTEIVISSQLSHVPSRKDEKVAAICNALGATHYLSGAGAKKYNRPEIFGDAGISLVYSQFHHPQYAQPYGDFVPGLSLVDALFSCGPETKKLLINR